MSFRIFRGQNHKNMSNLSDIGFPVRNEQDVNAMIEAVIEQPLEPTKCYYGFYLKFADASGAEIYLQGSRDQELVGFNPHFAGKSRRNVTLLKAIERDSSTLDGGFVANAAEGKVISDEYDFVFDAPDFRLNEITEFPVNCDIQLTAFASNDLKIFANEVEFYYAQDVETQMSLKSFFASGLYLTRDNQIPVETPRPIGIISGEIKEFDLRKNELSGENFYWFLIETLGGEVDVVADPKLVAIEPKIGGSIRGQFWLSGRILNSIE